jgi:hypothetical protein
LQTGAGTGEIEGVVTAMVMTAVVAASTCYGSAAAATLRRASPAAVAALPLDERRLMGMDVSALSAFAGARGETVDATLRMRNQKD